ncbi:MAG TPA: heme o synthase [Polyangiaceae bacterium]|nr:heme o synthase [Polyangiaceae bacterium]
MANSELLGARPQSASDASPGSRIGATSFASVVSFARDLIALTKPRITALVLLTEAAGAHLAPGAVSARNRWLSLLGTALVVGSANALNMWWERDVDAHMTRTRTRPLPAGRMSPDVALGFGLLLAVVSLPMLFWVNAMTGFLGLVSLIGYVAVYTPMKRHTHLALLVGAVPGAIPPLLGWSTVTGTIGLGGFLLFAFLFVWQIPHFAAITIFRAEEYRRAGLQVVSVQHGEAAAKRMIAGWTVLLVATSLSFGAFSLAGRVYELVAALLGAAFLALVFRGPRGPRAEERAEQRAEDHARSRQWAKRVFAFSIPYLAILLLTLLFDRIPT